MSKKLISIGNARTEHQKKVMEKIKEFQECPFCEENLKKYHKEEILKRGKYWTLTKNQWPYDFTKLHLLAITRKHVENLNDLPKASFGELLELFQWAEKEYDLKHGAIGVRFGEVSNTGATVLHLHAHLIVADTEHPDYKTVRFKVG